MELLGTQPLTTQRLTLDHLTMDDAPSVAQWAANPLVYRYLQAKPKTPCAVKQILALVVAGYAHSDVYYWAIRLQGQQDVIGSLFVDNLDIKDEWCAIEFLLDPKYWGMGYLHEGLTAVMDYMFNQVGMHRVQAKCSIANRACERALQRVGMRREGVLREALKDAEHENSWSDLVLYGLTQQEWRAMHGQTPDEES